MFFGKKDNREITEPLNSKIAELEREVTTLKEDNLRLTQENVKYKNNTVQNLNLKCNF